MSYSENVKSRMFACRQTLSLGWQRETACDGERQEGLDNFICFEQNVFEDYKYLLFLLLIDIGLGKPTMF